jgi:hypothetical protein
MPTQYQAIHKSNFKMLLHCGPCGLGDLPTMIHQASRLVLASCPHICHCVARVSLLKFHIQILYPEEVSSKRHQIIFVERGAHPMENGYSNVP